MNRIAFVFYEDRRGQPQSEFTLHAFVLACVRARVARPSGAGLEKRILSVTPKNVDEAIKRFKDTEHGRGEQRVLLADRDRIAEHLKGDLPRNACRQQIFERLLQVKVPTKDRLTVVLMEQCLEDFLRHIGSSQHFPELLRQDLERAVHKSRMHLQSRDLVLSEARKNEALRAHAATFPSIARLVDRLVQLTESAP